MNYAKNDRVVCKLLGGTDWGFLDPDLGADELHVRGDDAATESLNALWADAWAEIGEVLTRIHVFGPVAAPELAGVGLGNGQDKPQPGSRPWGWWEYEWEALGLGLRGQNETEAAYLERYGLLLPGEREAMKAAAADAGPPAWRAGRGRLLLRRD